MADRKWHYKRDRDGDRSKTAFTAALNTGVTDADRARIATALLEQKEAEAISLQSRSMATKLQHYIAREAHVNGRRLSAAQAMRELELAGEIS